MTDAARRRPARQRESTARRDRRADSTARWDRRADSTARGDRRARSTVREDRRPGSTARGNRRAGSAAPGQRGTSAVLAVLWAAASAALAGLAVTSAVVLMVWGAESRSTASTGQALRVAVQGWLLGHHGALHLPGGDVGLLPLGLALLPAVLLLRSGTSLARTLRVHDLAGAGRAAAALTGTYTVLVVTTAAFAGGGETSVSAPQTLLGAALLATLAGGAGVLRGAGLGQRAFRALPAHARLVVRASGAAVGVLLAAGALLAGAALVADLSRARELSDALTPGAVSGAALLLLGLLYAPNAAVWGAAYTVGPGFAVGAGTSVSAFGVSLGPVPAFPLLAALPEGEHAAPATWPFLAAPLVAGVVAGSLVAHRLATGDYGYHPPGAAGLWAVMSGAAAGAVFAVVAALSGGPLGSGRLAALGPSPWRVGLAAAAEIGAAAGVTAAALHWYALRRDAAEAY